MSKKDTKTTLNSYTDDGEDEHPMPPEVVKKRPVVHPKGRGTVGNVCWCHVRECNVYVTRRVRETHWYRKGRGYPISEKLFGRLQVQDVERVYIMEHETMAVYEFLLSQYTDPASMRLTHDEDDPQRCVKTRDAKYCWDNHAGNLFGGGH